MVIVWCEERVRQQSETVLVRNYEKIMAKKRNVDLSSTPCPPAREGKGEGGGSMVMAMLTTKEDTAKLTTKEDTAMLISIERTSLKQATLMLGSRPGFKT